MTGLPIPITQLNLFHVFPCLGRAAEAGRHHLRGGRLPSRSAHRQLSAGGRRRTGGAA